MNVKGGILTAQQNAKFPSTTRTPAQPNLNQNPLLRSTYTIISSNSNLSGPTHVKKQPYTGMQAPGQAPSNVGHAATITSNNSKNAALSVPVKSVSVRMSLGPMVKTRTGLIPAVTQPRNTTLHLTHNSATAPNTATPAANKVVSRTTSSLSVSQRSAVVQRKIISTTAVKNLVNERKTTLTARPRKVQQKSNLNPLLIKHSQPPCKSQLSSGQKSAPVSSKCKAAAVKPERKVGMSKTNQPAGQPIDGSTKQRSEDNGDKLDKLCKATSQLSLGSSGRCSSRKVSGVTRTAVAELGDKTMKYKETQSKKGCGSAQQTNKKRTGVPVMSQTVPQPARTISFTGKPTDKKTPKVPVRVIPHTEGKNKTSAQEERM